MPMIDWDALEAKGIEVCRAIAPCLGPIDYRIVDSALVPHITMNGCGGFTHMCLDTVLQPYIANPPPGRFVAIVLVRDAFELPKPPTWWGCEDSEYRFMELVIHELAHVAGGGYPEFWDLPTKPDHGERTEKRFVTHKEQSDQAALTPAGRQTLDMQIFR